MRLLHYNALGRLVLTDFHGKTIPPYAILSKSLAASPHDVKDAGVIIDIGGGGMVRTP